MTVTSISEVPRNFSPVYYGQVSKNHTLGLLFDLTTCSFILKKFHHYTKLLYLKGRDERFGLIFFNTFNDFLDA
jgi:hypothetical protein